jgi:hypothetical protein
MHWMLALNLLAAVGLIWLCVAEKRGISKASGDNK